jgi:hypothetical protein
VNPAGQTVYSQAPCPRDARSSTIRTDPAPTPAASAKGEAKGPKTAAELEQEFRKRRQEQAEAEKKSSEAAAQAREKEENCKNARAQLVGLETTGRQMRFDANGERRYLNDAEIEAEKDKARRVIQASCG